MKTNKHKYPLHYNLTNQVWTDFRIQGTKMTAYMYMLWFRERFLFLNHCCKTLLILLHVLGSVWKLQILKMQRYFVSAGTKNSRRRRRYLTIQTVRVRKSLISGDTWTCLCLNMPEHIWIYLKNEDTIALPTLEIATLNLHHPRTSIFRIRCQFHLWHRLG